MMNTKQHKSVRFEDWSWEQSFDLERQCSPEGGSYSRKTRPSVSAVLSSIRRGIEKNCEKIKGIRKRSRFDPVSDRAGKESGSEGNIFYPEGAFLQKWNKIFLLACVIAVAVDPLFFYIPVIDRVHLCLNLDKTLETTACIIRTFIDGFYILRIVFQFRTGFMSIPSQLSGRGKLVDDPWAIAERYGLPYFIIDVLAILPLPQLVVLAIIPKLKNSHLLKFIVLIQYVPRLIRVIPLFKEVTRNSGRILTETAWAGAVFYLILYMLASHIVGAFWYLISIEREDRCWRDACKGNDGCIKLLYCQKDPKGSQTFLNLACPLIEVDKSKNSTDFDFGIFLDVLQSGMVESKDFSKKFFYCFWWGLRNLSSLGQNLKTSTFVDEIVFAIFISIFGLLLFSLLIGNMQKYLQSTAVRIEEITKMRVKKQDTEQWMSNRMFPIALRERIRRHNQYKWQATRGFDEENMVRNLPKDLRRDVKRHLGLALLMRVPMFDKMDTRLLDAICDRLKQVFYPKKSLIVREGDPVDEMLFIKQGNLVTMTTNGGTIGFFNSVRLKAGDFCGESLLAWALDPRSSSNHPISTWTVETLTDVEAFALMADDLKAVASQFRFLDRKQLQHTLRFYSQQFRTWAVCFIQAAWRRHCKRKLDKSLREAEDLRQDALANEVGTSPSLGATIYASRFAANALRTLRRNGALNTTTPHRLLPLLPQKAKAI